MCMVDKHWPLFRQNNGTGIKTFAGCRCSLPLFALVVVLCHRLLTMPAVGRHNPSLPSSLATAEFSRHCFSLAVMVYGP